MRGRGRERQWLAGNVEEAKVVAGTMGNGNGHGDVGDVIVLVVALLI